MIKYLKHNEIDKSKWDECILNSFNGSIYAYSWYLDIIHEDWEALVEDDYQRVMPLTVKTKYGITYFKQPYFAQQLGVFSMNVLNPEIINDFINDIPDHIKIIDANFNSFNSLTGDRFDVFENNNYQLDLISEYPKIASKYSTNTKRNLKKAIKNNLQFMKGIKPELIVDLFRNNRGKHIKNWDDRVYNTILRLAYTSIHKGAGFTCGIYTELNELCAGAFFLKTKTNLIFLFSGANDFAKSTGAMTLLIDTIIRNNAPGIRIFDFEGSNNENLARFYKGFGAKNSKYNRLKISRLGPVSNFFFRILRLI